MSFITDAGPGSAAVRDARLADDEPSVNIVLNIQKSLAAPASDGVWPSDMRLAHDAAFNAIESAMAAVDDIAPGHVRERRARIADAEALRAAIEAGDDPSDLVVDANLRVAKSETAKRVAVAWARIRIARGRVADFNALAKSHAADVEQAARDHLAEVAPRYANAIDDALAERGAYVAAVADVASAIAFRVEVEHRGAGPTNPDRIRAAVAAVPKPNTESLMRVGTRRVEIGDALAAIQQDARRHVEREPREPTADDHALKVWAEDRTSKDPGRIQWH